jgi:hypothetical protein
VAKAQKTGVEQLMERLLTKGAILWGEAPYSPAQVRQTYCSWSVGAKDNQWKEKEAGV